MRILTVPALSLGLLVACQSTGIDTHSTPLEATLTEPVIITMGVGGVT